MTRFRGAVFAGMFGGLLWLGAGPVRGQIPAPRLQSVYPPGGQAGTNLDVALAGADLEGVHALWFDHPGLRAFALKGLTFRVAIAPGTPAGAHEVRAVSPLGISNPRAFVVSDRPEILETEPNNQLDRANAIPLPVMVNGQVTATDIDCFRFEGRKNQRVLIEVETARIDSRLDALCRLYGPDAKELAESRAEPGADPLLDVVLPADGAYTIKLHDVIYAGSTDHFYRLHVHDGPHIDAVLPVAAKPGTPTRFTFWGRNLDGTECAGRSLDGHALERVEVSLTPPEPSAVGDALDSGPIFSPSATRRGFSYQWTGPRGTSNPIFIAEAADPVVLEQEPDDDDAHAQRITLPCDISGSFATVGDLDVYRFQGRKGDVWWVEATAERIGSPADPTFVVQKVLEKGPAQDLASGDDTAESPIGARFPTGSVDAAVRWQVPEDGTYQVVINDLYNSQRGSPRLTYRLQIRPERPHFALFAIPQNPGTQDLGVAMTLRAGGGGWFYVIAMRSDGYNRPIQVQAVDLPRGVTCAPVVIGPGQMQAPVVLEAAPDAQLGDVVIQLEGRGLSPDRKEILDYTHGTPAPLGRPEPLRPVQAAGMVWLPTNVNGANVPGPTRLTRGFVLAVREGAPYQLKASPAHWDVPPGGTIELKVEVARRSGFTEAVQLGAIDLPPNMGTAGATIAKDATSTTLKLPVAANVPPGTYTFLLQGTGAFPFSKDPNAKQKPNVNAIEPSNPITLSVRK